MLGAELLSSDNHIECSEIARQLELLNNERRAIEQVVFEQALAKAQEKAMPESSHVVVYSRNWHQGIIGIISSRLKEKFNKPVVVIAIENKVGKASCRSITGIDVGSIIVNAKTAQLLIDGGGHSMAAGFTIREENIPKLEIFISEQIEAQLRKKSLSKQYYFDSYLSINAINLDLVKKIENLGPFGPGNSEPIFAISNVLVKNINLIGNEHLSCFLTDQKIKTNSIKATAFRVADTHIATALLSGKVLTILGALRANCWNNRTKAEFFITDVAYE